MSLFLVTAPGLEPFLADEARGIGLHVTGTVPGGVSVDGGWPEMVKANLLLRGAARVLFRLTEFRALHLAQLDKRARKLPWSDWLRPEIPIRVEAICRKSRIYHHRAAAQRVERAITETLGCPVARQAPVTLKVRIEDDLCTISVDTSGDALHKRGLKQQLNKAPMRENLAALFLRACAFDGGEPVVDPMCGSGTFPIEAAEIATGMAPGRARNFAFEQLAGYDPDMRPALPEPKKTPIRFYGMDRDQGACKMSLANADRAGVSQLINITCCPISEAAPPEGKPGLVIVNPPYGGRIGNKKPLYGLYAAFGQRMMDVFSGWRIGLITSEPALAKATGLPFGAPGPIVDHGGISIRLWQTDRLP